MSIEERRRYPRYAVDLPGRLNLEGASFDVRLKDICHEAVLVETPQPCRVGATGILSAEILGGSGEIEISGRVIRVAEPEDGGPGAAILFTSLNPAAATQIAFFLELQN
jgi:hypothetical protein